ncbi:MAG: methyltransferase domain-containing protein, partial [Thermoplasmata archaeon]
RALLDFVPGARAVAVDRGVRGPLRLRDLQIIAGEGPLRTVHRENGLEFAVDLERAYFSPRLAREHDRVARAARPGERVLDLCCGVGPFALTLASRTPSLRVTAVDLNPEAIVLLRENLHRLQLEGRIEAECAEAEEHLRRSGPYDRAILNLPHAGAPLLGPLVDRIVPGGYVHYYEIVERAEASTRRKGLVQGLPPRGTWQLAEEHIVHEYSPSADLRGYTLSRSPASGD